MGADVIGPEAGIGSPCDGVPVVRQADDIPGLTEGTEPARRGSPKPRVSRMLPRKEVSRGGVSGVPEGFELADAGLGALEHLVLHQHGLDQRIGGVGRALKAVVDRLLGPRIARGVLQRDKAVEQLVDEIAFLWGHRGRVLLP